MPYLDKMQKRLADERFRRRNGILTRPEKKPSASRLKIREWLKNAEGLDTPMIAPWLIPEDCVQDYDNTTHRWRVRKKGERNYLPYFPVIKFEKDRHPDMLL